MGIGIGNEPTDQAQWCFRCREMTPKLRPSLLYPHDVCGACARELADDARDRSVQASR